MSMRMWLLCVAAWSSACSPAQPARRERPASAPRVILSPDADGTAPGVAATPTPAVDDGAIEPRFVELEVDGHPNPIVWEPPRTSEALPLVVVAHGAGGGPEWHCEFWSRVVEESAFLLCLRGEPLGGAYGGHYFPEHHTLERMFVASVSAADARYGERLLESDNVYIGYSQGATMGALMIVSHATRFSRLLLIEGGYGQWNVKRALSFKEAGGVAVFIACGTRTCDTKAASTVAWFERARSLAKTGTAHGEGHTPGGRVGAEAVSGLGWLLSQR